jgi:RIO-like serine/threonine protein kinase
MSSVSIKLLSGEDKEAVGEDLGSGKDSQIVSARDIPTESKENNQERQKTIRRYEISTFWLVRKARRGSQTRKV